MRLVYLDHSHVVLLSEVRSRDPSRYAQFLAVWRQSDAQLALSRVHMTEMRRHDVAEVRESRYQMLSDFLPITTDVAFKPFAGAPGLTVTDREILRAMLARGLRLPAGSDAWRDQTVDVFPLALSSDDDMEAMRALEDEAIREMIDLSFVALEGAAKAGERPKGEAYQRTRVRDLSTTPLSPEQAAAMKATFDNALATASALQAINEKLPKDLTAELARQQAERIYRLIDRAVTVGMRSAYAEVMGITANLAEDNRYLDDISNSTTFAWQVTNFARRVLNVQDDVLLDRMADQLPLDACPGTWLNRAVDLEIRRNEHEPNPNNAYDLDHLCYLPYVHLFFADKRIAAYCTHVLRRPDLPASCVTLKPPTRTRRAIDALEEAVSQLARAT